MSKKGFGASLEPSAGDRPERGSDFPKESGPRRHFPKAEDAGPSMSDSSYRRRHRTSAVEREAIRRGEEAIL